MLDASLLPPYVDCASTEWDKLLSEYKNMWDTWEHHQLLLKKRISKTSKTSKTSRSMWDYSVPKLPIEKFKSQTSKVREIDKNNIRPPVVHKLLLKNFTDGNLEQLLKYFSHQKIESWIEDLYLYSPNLSEASWKVIFKGVPAHYCWVMGEVNEATAQIIARIINENGKLHLGLESATDPRSLRSQVIFKMVPDLRCCTEATTKIIEDINKYWSKVQAQLRSEFQKAVAITKDAGKIKIINTGGEEFHVICMEDLRSHRRYVRGGRSGRGNGRAWQVGVNTTRALAIPTPQQTTEQEVVDTPKVVEVLRQTPVEKPTIQPSGQVGVDTPCATSALETPSHQQTNEKDSIYYEYKILYQIA